MQSVERMESFGIKVSDQMYDQMQQSIMDAPVWRTVLQTGVSMLVITPLIYLAIAGILFGVFSAALGGGATFKQVFAVDRARGRDLGARAGLHAPDQLPPRVDDRARRTSACFLPMLRRGQLPREVPRHD